MQATEENRQRMNRFAEDLYSQGLNLTLSNTLLRLPTGARSTKFIEVEPRVGHQIVRALLDEDRSITFIGNDASPAELRLAELSEARRSEPLLRVRIDRPHAQLESLLRTLARANDELIQKRGLPCGYFTIGLLHWKAEDTPTRSPLLLLPVDFEAVQDPVLRKTVYTLTRAERPALENPALREYLRLKFKLHLPPVSESDESDKDSMLDWLREEAANITLSRKDWSVSEAGVFGLFDCGAVAADCDPTNWAVPLGDRELLTKFFLSTDPETPPTTPDSFCPNNLVLDADGSQIHALHRVSAGANIVLHGPPGSGKSQTIVNLIAQALAANKTVLFVAQKPEAAHVVHRRLATCHLDPFCSMLVPVGDSKNTKSAMLRGLRTRSTLPPSNPAVLSRERTALELNTTLLSRYAAALRIAIPSLGLTARDVMARLATLSLKEIDALDPTDIAQPSNVAAFSEAITSLQQLAETRREIPDEVLGLLGGIRPTDSYKLAQQSAAELVAALRKIHDASSKITSASIELSADGAPVLPHWLPELVTLQADLPPVAELTEPSFLARANRLRAPGAPEALQRFSNTRALLSKASLRIPGLRNRLTTSDIPPSRNLRDSLSVLEAFELADLQVRDVSQVQESIEQIRAALASSSAIPGTSNVTQVLSKAYSLSQWKRILSAVEFACSPDPARTFFTTAFRGSPPSVDAVHQLAQSAKDYSIATSTARQYCRVAELPSLESLRFAHSSIASRSCLSQRLWGSIADAQYKQAKRIAIASVLPGVSRNLWPTALSAGMTFTDTRAAWESYLAAAGADQTSSAEPSRWSSAADWYQKLDVQASAAGLPRRDLWTITREAEEGSTSVADIRVRSAAARLVAAEKLMTGFDRLISGRAVTIELLCDCLSQLSSALACAQTCQTELNLPVERKVSTVLDDAQLLIQLRDATKDLEGDPDVRRLFAGDFSGLDTAAEPYEHAMRWLADWAETKDRKWDQCLHWVLERPECAESRGRSLHHFAEALTFGVSVLCTELQKLQANYVFGGAAARLSLQIHRSLFDLTETAARILQAESHLTLVFEFGVNAQRSAVKAGRGIVDRISSGLLDTSRAADSYERTALETALRHDPELNALLAFDRRQIESAASSLGELDRAIRSNNAQQLVSELKRRVPPRGRFTGYVREYTENGLIRHLLGLQRPRFEIQDLFKRAGEAMRQLQPCVIATPSTVSEHLPRDGQMFDLLIIDEASQLPPSAAFGAIARCKQAVIVGDPKQLPPTSFFLGQARTNDDDVEDEDSIGVTDVESILDRAISALENVHLRGHYRSRHHSLISFSNRRFYDQRLVVTPSTAPRDSVLGVVAHHVKEGTYKNSVNEFEAKAVARRAMDHLLRRSSESLGIVAFNKPQADAIQLELELLARESQTNFNAFTSACRATDSLFVRNLESVQGDERDLIFISYTYGPDPEHGKVYQRFGPLLQTGGERRLNVLVTRAKTRVEVFHSLLPTQITAEAQGAAAMRAYLEHAQSSPRFDFAVGDCESEFEQQVQAAITSHFNDLVVRPQIGCDHFRIDLGVSLASNPERFILGIECDGATYHGTLVARDRDLVRQMILEHHGWTIHRIWSTAWWKNSKHELERLLHVVQTARLQELARLGG